MYQIWYCFVAFSIIRRGADDESLSFSRRGGKSRKPNYLMMLFLWHSLLLVVTKPTCDGVYQVWYGFVLISITRRGGMDDKLWISWQNGHAYLVAVRFDSFFHVTILFFYQFAPVQALRHLSLKENDEYLLLLVTSNVWNLENKALQYYGKIVCHFYRCWIFTLL